MWFDFILAALVCSAILLVPGYLLLRASGLQRPWSACLAPLFTVSVACVLGEVYARAGIPANPLTILLVPAVIALVAALALRSRTKPLSLPNIPAWLPAVYVLVAIVVGALTFGTYVLDPNGTLLMSDYPHHANMIRTLLDSQHFSSLGTNFYTSAADAPINPIPTSSFYPSAWHITCALVVQCTGIAVPTVINAVYFTFASVVYPLAALALLTVLFKGDARLMKLGAFVAPALVIFPWGIVMIGPIYANQAGLSAMPAALLLFVHLTSSSTPRRERSKTAALFVLGCIGLALLHPNTIFSMGVVLIPYCALSLLRSEGLRLGRARVPGWTLMLAFLAFCVAVWLGCYKLPMFEGLVSYTWPAYMSPKRFAISALGLTFVDGKLADFGAQFLYGALVLVGLVRALRNRAWRWLPISYAFACFLVFTAVATSGMLKQFLCGFWYTDPYRLASIACVVAVPLGTLGLAWAFGLVEKLVARLSHRRGLAIRLAYVLAALALLANVQPSMPLPGGETGWRTYWKAFGVYENYIRGIVYTSEPYPQSSKDFVEKAKQVVPEGDLVINMPIDGSFLAYGVNDLRVYYRMHSGFYEDTPEARGSFEEPTSILIRTRLNEISTNQEVHDAVEQIGGKYVLQLDDAMMSSGNWAGSWRPSLFPGIRNITEDTPGFKLVLSEGNNRLYEIVE